MGHIIGYVVGLFIWSIDSEGVMPKKEAITIILGYATIFNFVVSTYILIKSACTKEIKLCKHDWEYIDKNEVTTVIGCAVDIDMVYTYQCKSCLKVRKSYSLWEGVK